MGIGFSQQKDNYILRVIESLDTNDSPGVNHHLSRSNSTLLNKSNKRTTLPEMLNNSNKYKEIDNSTGTPPLNKGKSGKLDVSQSKIHPVPPLTKSASRLSSTNLISNRTTTSCSDYYPWLLKNAKFSGSSLNDFEFGRIIGRGYTGTVMIARSKSLDKYCVVKCVNKESVLKRRDKRHIESEKIVLSSVNSSFCIKLFGTFQDKNYLYFAMEFACGGELFHRLGKKKFFSPDTAKFYISEVFVALEHIQSLGYVYRDLKPENIILDEEGHCKLVDFGFSTKANSEGMLHTFCGTPAYLAPEILDGKFTNGYTKVVDWWSFGILIYELLTGKTPFCKSNRDSVYEIFLRILQNKIWFPIGFDSKSKELVSRLTYPHLEKRLTNPDEIKNHSYFTIPWRSVADRKLVPPFVPRISGTGDTHYFKNYGSGSKFEPTSDVGSSYEFPDF